MPGQITVMAANGASVVGLSEHNSHPTYHRACGEPRNAKSALRSLSLRKLQNSPSQGISEEIFAVPIFRDAFGLAISGLQLLEQQSQVVVLALTMDSGIVHRPTVVDRPLQKRLVIDVVASLCRGWEVFEVHARLYSSYQWLNENDTNRHSKLTA